jgi:hypothetical protein
MPAQRVKVFTQLLVGIFIDVKNDAAEINGYGLIHGLNRFE